MSNRFLHLAPLIFLILWSGGYGVAAFGLAYAEPMTMLSLRFALVLVIMVPAFFIIRPPLPETLADWGHLAFVGFLIQSMYFGFCWLAFKSGIAAGVVALIMAFQPILVAIIAPRWNSETVGKMRWFGLVLGLVGTAIVIVARSELDPPNLFGMVCSLLGLVAFTVGTLWEKKFGKTHHPITANLVGYSAGLLGVLPFMAILGVGHIDWTWQFGAAMFYLVVGNSILAIGLLLALIRAGDVSSVSSLFFLVPPLAALLAYFLLGEVMPPMAWVGMVVAAGGVWLATRPNPTRP